MYVFVNWIIIIKTNAFNMIKIRSSLLHYTYTYAIKTVFNTTTLSISTWSKYTTLLRLIDVFDISSLKTPTLQNPICLIKSTF